MTEDLWSLVTRTVRPDGLLHASGGDGPVRHGDLLHAAGHTAGQIVETLGGRYPRRVGLLLNNGEPWLRGLLAIWRLGATAVPLPLPVAFAGPSAYRDHLRAIAGDADLDAVLVGGDFARLINQMPEPVGAAPLIDVTGVPATAAPVGAPPAQELAVIQYTSGSTSRPKGVMLTHDNVAAGLSTMAAALRWGSDDVAGMWVPLFHDMGLFSLVMSLVRGADIWLWQPQDFVRRPMRWLTEFARAGATGVPAANFFYDMLADAAERDGVPDGLDLSRWRLGINGSEPVQRGTIERFEAAFGPYGLRPGVIQPTYGMAEATLMITFAAPLTPLRSLDVDRDRLSRDDRVHVDDAAPAGAHRRRTVVSCGSPVDEVRVRIADAADVAVPEDVIGEIQISGAPVSAGYLSRPPEEQPSTADGWVRTGDLGFLHDGELYVTGRLKDMIIIRGQNYYAEDVEQIVRSTPGVGNRRVVAFADRGEEHGRGDGHVEGDGTGRGEADGGERMVVLWETRLDPDEAGRLVDDIRQRLGRQLGLAAVQPLPVAVSTIPCTSSGKVKRHVAQRQWRNETGRVDDAAGTEGSRR